MPDGFANRPELTPLEVFYWTAFRDLGTERQIGMGLGPIPWSSARAYADLNSICDPDDFDNFWTIIGTVDAEYLKSQNEKSTPSKPAKSGDKIETSDGPISKAMQKKKGKAKAS